VISAPTPEPAPRDAPSRSGDGSAGAGQGAGPAAGRGKADRDRPATPVGRPVAALLLVSLFVVALLPRTIGLGGAVTEDEDQWIDRSGTFARALLDGEWRRTFLTGHPGVTVMWLTTAALGPTRAASYGEAARPPTPPGGPVLISGKVPVTTMPDFLSTIHRARIAFVVVNAALAALVGLLAARVFGLGPGVLGGLLLALDPYWAGVSPIVGMDGPLAGFTSAALLCLILACRRLILARPTRILVRPARRHGAASTATGRLALDRGALAWVALAGALWGLAFLTKTTALFLAPLVPLLALAALLLPAARRWRRSRRLRRSAERAPATGATGQLHPEALPSAGGPLPRSLAASVLGTALVTLAWGVVGIVASVLLWPAAWDQPLLTLWRTVDFSARLGGEPHGPGNVFLGRPTDTPGPMFYPVALAFRLGPATTLGLMALLLFGAPRRLGFAAWSLLGYVALFLLLLTLAAKKVDRYLLPILPSLDVLAGVGWWACVRWLAGRRAGWRRGRATGGAPGQVPERATGQPFERANGGASLTTGMRSGPAPVGLALTGLALVGLQAWPLAVAGRYPLATYNPLFGGARSAERAIPLGWGDGLDVAADRVRDLSGGAPVTISIWYPLWVNFQAHAPGPVVTERRLADADYYIDYVHARQRGLTPRQLANRRPDAVVQIAGVDYARIYRLR